MPKTTEVKLVLIGLGNIGRRFLQVLDRKAGYLCTRHGLSFKVVGAADSRGATVDPTGLDLSTIVDLKREKRSVAEYPDCGRPGMLPLDLVQQTDADALCEASPVDLKTGEIEAYPFALPRAISVHNFVEAWQVGEFSRHFLSSAVVAGCSVGGLLLLGSMAGFAFARFRIPAASLLIAVFMIALVLPVESIVFPLKDLTEVLGIEETWPALIGPYIALEMPLAIPHNYVLWTEVDGNDIWVGTSKGLARGIGRDYFAGLRDAETHFVSDQQPADQTTVSERER